jgi:hypothetical protein
MEQLKCLSCGYVNMPGDGICRECGAALTAPNTAVVAEPAFVPPPADTVVVQRGVSQSAMLATFLLGLAGIVVVGVLMYQWGKDDASDEDLARERAERTERASRDVRPTSTTTPPPPVVTPAPAPAPVIIPVPTAPSTYVPTSPSQGTSARSEGVATYVSTVDPLLEDWNEFLKAAETQTGDTLAQSLDRMRDLQKQASRMQAPAAAGAVHGRLLTAMSAMIDALAAGSSGGGFPTDSEAYRQANELFEKFRADYDKLKITS